MFTGEMMYPWMFAETRLLRPFKGAVDLLAEKTDWSSLYDSEKLAANTVPVAAIVYHDDMYVDAGLSLAAASKVGNLHAWVTNEFEHDGLGSGTVLPRLFAMIDELGGPLQDRPLASPYCSCDLHWKPFIRLCNGAGAMLGAGHDTGCRLAAES